MSDPDDAGASEYKITRRRRRDEILADAATPEHGPGAPRGIPRWAAWRTQRPTRGRAPLMSEQPQIITIEPEDAPDGDDIGPNRPRWASFAALVVLTMLVLMGGAVWRLSGPGGPQQPAVSAPPASFELLALPGRPDARGGEMTVTEAADRHVLPDLESKLLRQDGIDEVHYAGSVYGQYKFLMYAYPSTSPDAARTTTKIIAGIHERLGLENAHVGDLPGGVPAVELRNSRATVMRTLYTSGSFTVQLSVLQEPTGDKEALRAEFRRMVTLVAASLPPEPQGGAGG